MRSKVDILNDSQEERSDEPQCDFTASLIQKLLLESVIDIRDIIELRACQIIDRIAEISHKD